MTPTRAFNVVTIAVNTGMATVRVTQGLGVTAMVHAGAALVGLWGLEGGLHADRQQRLDRDR